MKLDALTPHRLSSAMQRNWTAEIPPLIVAGAIILVGLIFKWPPTWLLMSIAVIASFATDIGMAKVRHQMRVKNSRIPPPTFPDPPEFDVGRRAKRWAEILGNDSFRSFVLFSYGTCIVLVDDDDNPTMLSKSLLKQYGHSIPGTPSADMLVYTLPDTDDFVIGGYHPNILTFVPRDTFPPGASSEDLETVAGLTGRELRVMDTFALNVVHTQTLDTSKQ